MKDNSKKKSGVKKPAKKATVTYKAQGGLVHATVKPVRVRHLRCRTRGAYCHLWLKARSARSTA
jgi:hypothetical protein